MPQRHTSDESAALPVLNAAWSLSVMHCDAPNEGLLSLSILTPNAQLALHQGYQIRFIGLPDGWGVKVRTSSNWTVSSGSLVWRNAVPLSFGAFTQDIGIILVPPLTGASQIVIQIELLDDAGNAITQMAPIFFNLVTPEAPLVAYAFGSTYLLLSNPEGVEYENSIFCTLRNTCADAIAGPVEVTVSLVAEDSSGAPVDISQNLGSDQLSLAIVNEGTSASIPVSGSGGLWKDIHLGAVDANALFTLSIRGLEVTQVNIQTLQVKVTVNGVSKQPYDSCAYFKAIGPYSIGLTKDTTNSSASKYSLHESAPGEYVVNFVVDGMNQPPLNLQLLDRNLQPVIPPIPGSFSWGTGEIKFPIGYQLSQGANHLYWLDTSSSSDGSKVLASCVIQLTQLTKNSPTPICFTGMDLTGTNLSDWSNLHGVVSGGVIGTPPLPPKFSWKMGYIVGPGVSLDAANFGQMLMNSNGVTLYFDVPITAASLRGADLTYVDFTRCPNGDNADFTDANLTQTQFGPGRSFKNAVFVGADFFGAFTNGSTNPASVSPALDFTGTDFSNAKNFDSTNGGTWSGIIGPPKTLPGGWYYCGYSGSFYKGLQSSCPYKSNDGCLNYPYTCKSW